MPRGVLRAFSRCRHLHPAADSRRDERDDRVPSDPHVVHPATPRCREQIPVGVAAVSQGDRVLRSRQLRSGTDQQPQCRQVRPGCTGRAIGLLLLHADALYLGPFRRLFRRQADAVSLGGGPGGCPLTSLGSAHRRPDRSLAGHQHDRQAAYPRFLRRGPGAYRNRIPAGGHGGFSTRRCGSTGRFDYGRLRSRGLGPGAVQADRSRRRRRDRRGPAAGRDR